MVNFHTLAICQSKRFDKFYVCVYLFIGVYLTVLLKEGLMTSDDVKDSDVKPLEAQSIY